MIRLLFPCLLGGFLTVVRAETLKSPDGRLGVEISLVGNRLSYSVVRDSGRVVETSPLGFTLNGVDHGEDVAISSSVAENADETFPSRHGVHTVVRNHYQGRRITVTHKPSGIAHVLNLRAYDSGIAFCYELNHRGAKELTGETSSFVLPRETRIWSQRGTDVYENIYSGADLAAVPADSAMGPPVVSRLPGGAGYVAITQSAPETGFPNPFLVKTKDRDGLRLQVAYPRNGDGSYGASAKGNIRTPWNVVMVGGSLNELVNSDIVESLAPAPDPAVFPEGAATSWARPGRSVWDWMSRFPGGITAENAKLNSYWASQLGWEYNTIDEGWGAWNKGNPWPRVREITEHARPLGVGILLWVRSADLKSHERRTEFFKRAKAAGASGFKADFFDFESVSPAAKERVELVEAILKESAGYQLVANLHGTGKPLGQFRTYPNLLNFESVFGKEQFPNARASVHAPLTRLLCGPADYTPLGLAGNLKGPQTAAFEIASAITMAGPLITFAERSDIIAKSAFVPVIRSIPCLWDETVILPGSEIGQSCGMVRRKGNDWFAAIMNADSPRTWSLELDFLKPGENYQAEIIRDGSGVIEHRMVNHTDRLEVSCSAGGGFVAKFGIPSRTPVSAMPFATHFCTGRGSVYAEKGAILLDESWADPLLADRLPDTLWSITSAGTSLRPEFDSTDPYQGGSSLKLSGTLDARNDLALFRTDLPVSSTTRLSFVFKHGNVGGKSGMQIGLSFSDSPQTVFYDAGVTDTTGWNARKFDLSAHAGKSIKAISLRFESDAAISRYEMNLGGLSIHDEGMTAVRAPEKFRVERSASAGADLLDVELAWAPPRSSVKHHMIYQKCPATGRRIWLGATSTNSFNVSEVRRFGEEADAVFEVEAVGSNKVASSPARVAVPLPELPEMTHLLAGEVIGTSGAFGKSRSTREKVYDNDEKTHFDGPASDGVWAGIDLGSSRASRVTAIRYFPRESWPDRMVGGVFQGANRSDFSDAMELARITASPRPGGYTLLAVDCAQPFRYLRYLSPKGGWGNVAEVRFFGP